MPTHTIGLTTVSIIKRDADKTEKHASTMQSIDGNIKVRKTMKPGKLDQLDTVVYQWFILALMGIPVSDPIKIAKASEIKKKIIGKSNYHSEHGLVTEH